MKAFKSYNGPGGGSGAGGFHGPGGGSNSNPQNVQGGFNQQSGQGRQQQQKRQFCSNIKTAEPASILSYECMISLTRRTQWVVDSPSCCLQLVKSTIDIDCLHVSLKF